MLPLSSLCSDDKATFLIGPFQKEYHLPEMLVNSLGNDNTLLALYHPYTVGMRTGALPIDWSVFMDERMFNLFVQYAYTGDYKVPEVKWEEDAIRAQAYKEARKHCPEAYWLYEDSPYVKFPAPASSLRCHAMVWNFARYANIDRLEQVAVNHLREALTDTIRLRSRSGDFFGMERFVFNDVVDVIGYVYHHGRRYWGATDVKPETPLLDDSMRLMVASLVRRYLCNGDETPDMRNGYDKEEYEKNSKTWEEFLRHVPLVAMDIHHLDNLAKELWVQATTPEATPEEERRFEA